jgi:ketosteroid isomerase-like protein
VSENVDLALKIIDAVNRGEDVFDLGLVAPDFAFVSPPEALEPGIRRGREGWRQVVQRLEDSYESSHVDVERIFEDGDRVILLSVFRVRGRGSGMEIADDAGYVLTLRDGLGVRMEWYIGHERTLRATGIDPQRASTPQDTAGAE